MKSIKRIPIVLKHIDWDLYVQQNVPNITPSVKNKLVKEIKTNLNDIKASWERYYYFKLSKILIDLNYLPHSNHLEKVDESMWLVVNNLCDIENICFWNKTRSSDGNKLIEPEQILLKDLKNEHIAAILDYCNENSITINEKYKQYFEKRIKN
jgi:hypothetical protein